MHYFPAIVEKSKGSDYGVSFPDFPGCVTAGATPEEALALAEEALQFHIDGMIEDGNDLPAATPIESVVRDPELDIVALTLVPARLPGKAVRINITMDEHLLAAADTAAATEGYSRSAFLAEAVRSRLAGSLELRLSELTSAGYRVIDAVGQIALEDEKKRRKDDHPPDIKKIGKTKRR